MDTVEESIQKDIEEGYLSSTGEPLKCWSCESTEGYNSVVTDLCGGVAFEEEAYCKSCGIVVGYMVQGQWQF